MSSPTINRLNIQALHFDCGKPLLKVRVIIHSQTLKSEDLPKMIQRLRDLRY